MSEGLTSNRVVEADFSQDEVVSSESEELILVDEQDREIGFSSKAGCHDQEGQLHRAFSVFVFNSNGKVLLQQRSPEKRLWPLYWSNSCCSHPRRGETMEQAVRRRLFQELRLRCDLSYLYKFQYQARFGDIGSENELCSVYAGLSDDPVMANGTEVADFRFVSGPELDRELQEHPDHFTPWFRLEWPRVKGLNAVRELMTGSGTEYRHPRVMNEKAAV